MDEDLFGVGGWQWREALLIAGVVFIVWAIFANEAYHGEEVAYVRDAEGFVQAGFKPLGVGQEWGEDWVARLPAIPPLARAWYGLSALVFGVDEIGLRFASFVAALLVALGTYALASSMTREPLATTLLAIATPVFVLYHNALTGALPALACTLWALVLWRRAVTNPEPAWKWAGAAAVLATTAPLCYYEALFFWPALIVFALLAPPGRKRYALLLAAPIAAVVCFDRMHLMDYPRGHVGAYLGTHFLTSLYHWSGPLAALTDAFGINRFRETAGDIGYVARSGLAHASYYLLPFALFLFLSWPRYLILLWAAVGGLAMLGARKTFSLMANTAALATAGQTATPMTLLVVQFAIALALGLYLVALLVDGWRQPRGALRTACSALAAGALLGGVLFWLDTAAMTLLALPAFAVLVSHRHTRWSTAHNLYRKPLPALLIVAALAASVGIGYADYRRVDAQRDLALRLTAEQSPQAATLLLDGTLRYYLVRAGVSHAGRDLYLDNVWPGDTGLLVAAHGFAGRWLGGATKLGPAHDTLVLPGAVPLRFNTAPYGRVTNEAGIVRPDDRRISIRHFRAPLPFIFAPAAPQRYEIWLRNSSALTQPPPQ